MGDPSSLDINHIVDELTEVEKLPPALGGKRVDVLRREAWEALAEKGIIDEVTGVNFLDRPIGSSAKVYRTKSGLYEIWLEQRLGKKGDVDVIVWELEKHGDQVVKAKAVGMDAHPRGPSDAAATSNQKAHFEKKKKLMEEWKKVAEDEGMTASYEFEESDQFFWRKRIDELKQLEKDAINKVKLSEDAKAYLTTESALAKILRAVGIELTIADTGLALIRFELAIYRSSFFNMLLASIGRGNYKQAKSFVQKAIDLPTGGERTSASDLYKMMLESFPLLGVGAMSQEVWEKLMKRLIKLIEDAEEKQKAAAEKADAR
jgi:hypothetical protein